MKTRKNTNHNHIKTRKHHTNIKRPSVKNLAKGFPLYASKTFSGEQILEYTKKNEEKYRQPCLLENLSWFGSYDVAKSYQTKETHMYQWDIKKNCKLLRINKENEHYFRDLFLNTNIQLGHVIQFSHDQIKKIKSNSSLNHPYLNMTQNEKAYYEFSFAFGYITVDEQYSFMKWIKNLIENHIIDIKMRNGISILNKLTMKTRYYDLNYLLEKQMKYNRLSFYDFDKHAILNLCKILKAKRANYVGVYQKNTTSFWFPDLIVYKMDIEETILFHPHHDLVYMKQIEG